MSRASQFATLPIDRAGIDGHIHEQFNVFDAQGKASHAIVPSGNKSVGKAKLRLRLVKGQPDVQQHQKILSQTRLG